MRLVYATVCHTPNVTRLLGNCAGGIMMAVQGGSASVILGINTMMTRQHGAKEVSHCLHMFRCLKIFKWQDFISSIKVELRREFGTE